MLMHSTMLKKGTKQHPNQNLFICCMVCSEKGNRGFVLKFKLFKVYSSLSQTTLLMGVFPRGKQRYLAGSRDGTLLFSCDVELKSCCCG